MEKVLEFLKSLVIPQKIAKHRYMSVLISIIIFMVSVYVLSMPITYQINNSYSTMKEQYNYLALQEIESHLSDTEGNEAVLQELANLECGVDKESLSMKCAKLSENQVFDKDIIINVDGIKKTIKFKVDLSKEDPTIEEILLDTEDYPYVNNEEIYLVLVLPKVLYFQAHQKGISDDITHNGEKIVLENRSYYYQNYMPELSLVGDEASARSLGGVIVEALILADIKAVSQQLTTYLFFIMFILPLIFVFIFWLVFKKNGKLTTYKEYYNIAAISSILPIVLTFILSWFWQASFEYYMYAFMLFYLYTLYRINNSPNEID